MADVNIRVRTRDEATRELKKINNTLKNMQQTTSGVGSASRSASTTAVSSYRDIQRSLTAVGVALGAVTAAIYTAKRAFDFAEEGAQLQRLGDTGEEVARQMGASFDEMVNKIQVSSRFAVSEMDVIRSANRAMVLGLTSDADQLANLMEVAAFRGRAMGLTTQQAFNDIVTGIGRLSPLILDNLGIVIDAEKRYAAWAEKTGMAADEIDAMTKRQILLEAVLEEGNQQLEAAGGLTEDNAEAYEMLNAVIADTVDLLKKEAAQRAASVVGPLSKYLRAQIELAKAVSEGAITQKEATEIMDRMIFTAYSAADAMEYLNSIERQSVDINQQLANDIAAANAELERRAEAAEKAAAAQLKQAFEDLKLFLDDPLGESLDRFNEKQDDLIRKAAELRDQIAELEDMPLTERGQIELRNLQDEFAETKQAILDNAAAHDEATKRIIVDLLMQQAAVDGVTQAEYNLILNVMEAWGLVGQSTVEAAKVMSQALAIVNQDTAKATNMVLQLGQAAAAVEGDYFIRFHVTVDMARENPELLKHQRFAEQKAKSIDDLIDEAFAPGTFTGSKFLGGFESKVKQEKEKAKKSAAEIALEIGRALSNIGSIAVRSLQENTIEPLKQQIQAIDKLMSPGHLDIIARERSVDLEERRADAVRKVAEAEQKVLEFQQKQQQIQSLQEQLDLLKLIKEHKLDPGILEGIKLGFDADMGQVLDAVTKAMDQIIGKAEDELGIASPSKKFERIGQQARQGFLQGAFGDDLIGGTASGLGSLLVPAGMPIGPMIDDRRATQAGMGTLQVVIDAPNLKTMNQQDIEELSFRVAEVVTRRARR